MGILEVKGVGKRFGGLQALGDVNLSVKDQSVHAIIGPNGAGKSTLLNCLVGRLIPDTGSVMFDGQSVLGRKPHEIAHLGIGFVPEERAIFPALTVEQNLLLGIKSGRSGGRWSIDETWRLFPQLKERANAPGGALSGGEQQMLTICRTLMGDPDLIMVDEPTEGLAPQMVERVGELLQEIARRGISILLVEQRLVIAMRISHRVYVMGHGRIVFEGTPADLMAAGDVRREWLEV